LNYWKYFVKREVDPTTLKYFLLAFNIKKRQLRIVDRRTVSVKVSEIIDLSSPKWVETLQCYQAGLKAYEEGKDIRKSSLYEHEYRNAPKEDKKNAKHRVKNFLALFDRIKTSGYQTSRQDAIRIMDISGMKKKPDPKFITTRFSKKYFRLTGMKRLIICNYLGIKKIPVRVLKTKVVQI